MRQLLALLLLTFVPMTASRAGAQGTEDGLVMGAIGDSITAGFNAQRLGDNRELSWSTGDSPLVESHLRRLQAEGRGPVTAYNESIAGSIASSLDRQISRLLRHSPDYVTLMVGANDVCAWPGDHQDSLREFETTLRAAVARLVEARPEIDIVMAPIPDLYNLWEVAASRGSCQAKWDLIGVCRPLLGRNVTPEERQAFVARWRDANAAIERVAREFQDNVMFDPDLMNVQFEWSHVSSMDCFHPSIAGQNLLAEKAWGLYLRER